MLLMKYLKKMKIINQTIIPIFTRFREIILYGIIGSLSAGTDFFIYYILTGIIGINYLVANIFSVSIGITISFVLNRKYNFKVMDHLIRRLIIFISVGLSGLLLSTILLYIFISMCEFDINIAKVLSIVLVVFLQFFTNKFVTFGN